MEESLKEKITANLDWFQVPKYMSSVLSIENESFEYPWKEEDFIRCLEQGYPFPCVGIVATHKKRAVGFMIYQIFKARIYLINLAVAQDYRRMGIGSKMIQDLIKKLFYLEKKRIVLEVRETNLPAQLFFRANEFRAVSVLRRHFEDTPEDAYLFRYRRRPRENARLLNNRVANLSG